MARKIKNIGINSQIKKIDFEHIEIFLKTCGIDLSAAIVLELFKANFFSDYANDNTSNDAFYNFVTRFKPESMQKADRLFKFEIKLLRKVEYLYKMKNTLVIKEFLRTIHASQRSKLIETIDLNNIESYIYNIILNARLKNKSVTKKEILYYIKHYKKYDINNELFLDEMIKKVKKKVYYQIHLKNLKPKELIK